MSDVRDPPSLSTGRLVVYALGLPLILGALLLVPVGDWRWLPG